MTTKAARRRAGFEEREIAACDCPLRWGTCCRLRPRADGSLMFCLLLMRGLADACDRLPECPTAPARGEEET